MDVDSVTWMENPFMKISSPGRRHFRLDSFQAGFPYTAEPVIIIRFCNAVAGTPAYNAHAGRATLAVPDLCGPFLEAALLSRHGCF